MLYNIGCELLFIVLILDILWVYFDFDLDKLAFLTFCGSLWFGFCCLCYLWLRAWDLGVTL